MHDAPTILVDRSLRRSLEKFSEDRLGWLDRAVELGPLSGLRFGPATVFVVNDADVARTVLVTDRAWTRPPAQRVPVALAIGENLFSAPDRRWKRVQPTIALAFRRRALEAPLAGLDEVLTEHIEAIPRDEDIDLGAVMARLAFVAAAWVMLGDRLDATKADELVEHQRHVVDWVGRRVGTLTAAMPFSFVPATQQMRSHRRVLERYVDDAIRRAERAPNVPPTFAAVREATTSHRSAGRERREQLLGLLFAGNETTAAALSWMLVHAAAHPGEWQRLCTESGRARYFVAETLRLSPPAWGVVRTPTRRSVPLRAGNASARVRPPAVVMLYLRGIQRSATYWHDPLRFDPDRHTDQRSDTTHGFIPFALGPRGCVGQQLALEELRMAVVPLAARGDVVTGAVEEDASFALRPRGSLRGRFVPRDRAARPA